MTSNQRTNIGWKTNEATRGALVKKILLLTAITLAHLSLEAFASKVTVLDRPIEVVIPSGYCEVGEHRADSTMVRLATENLNTPNRLLKLFAACDELAWYRNGKSKTVNKFGWVLATTQGGKLLEFKSVTRSQFIEQMSLQDFSVALREAKRLHKEQFVGVHIPSNGILGKASNALYVGILATMGDPTGMSRHVSGVVAMTFVKNMPFAIYLYQAYEKKSPDIRDLLRSQQSTAAEFVRMNE